MFIQLDPATVEEFRKARTIATGKKGGTYVAGSERQVIDKDGHKKTVRQYVKPNATPDKGDEAKPTAEPEAYRRWAEHIRKRGERDARLPAKGTEITRHWQGKEVKVTEGDDGRFTVHLDGKEAGSGRSLTGALSTALGKGISGYSFLRLGGAQEASAGHDWAGIKGARAKVAEAAGKAHAGAKVITEHLKSGGVRAHSYVDGAHFITDADGQGNVTGEWEEKGGKWKKVDSPSPSAKMKPSEGTGDKVDKDAKTHKMGAKLVDASRAALRKAGDAYSAVARGEMKPEDAMTVMEDAVINTGLRAEVLEEHIRNLPKDSTAAQAARAYLDSVKSAGKDIVALRRLHEQDMADGTSGKQDIEAEQAKRTKGAPSSPNPEKGKGESVTPARKAENAPPPAKKIANYGDAKKFLHEALDRKAAKIAAAGEVRKQALAPHAAKLNAGEITPAEFKKLAAPHDAAFKEAADAAQEAHDTEWLEGVDKKYHSKEVQARLAARRRKEAKAAKPPTDAAVAKADADARKAKLKELQEAVKTGKHETLHPEHMEQINHVHKAARVLAEHGDTLKPFGVKDTTVHVHPDAIRLTDEHGTEYAKIGHEAGHEPDWKAVAGHLRETLPAGVQVHDTPAPENTAKSLFVSLSPLPGSTARIPAGYLGTRWEPADRVWVSFRSL